MRTNAAMPASGLHRRFSVSGRRSLALTLVVSCISALALLAPTGAGAVASSSVTAPASVSGRVLDALGSGLSFTTVSLYPVGSSVPSASTPIGPDGTYTLANIVPGSYQLQFMGPPPLSATEQWYNAKPTRATADTLLLVAAQTLTGIDATLGQVITGRVTDVFGNPVGGAFVGAQNQLGTPGGGGAITGPDGSYRLTVAPARTRCSSTPRPSPPCCRSGGTTSPTSALPTSCR